MTVTNPVGQAKADPAPWVERLGRLGLIARGLTYFLIGVIALPIAFGGSSKSASQKGAFHAVAEQPFGEVLLWVIAAGLFGYALWQLIGAFSVHDDDRAKEWGKRTLHLVKTAIYLMLSWTAASIALHAGSTGGPSTAEIMKDDLGRVLVGLVGAVIVVTGVVLAWKGWTTDFEKKLRTDQMSEQVYGVVRTLGRVGYLARGVVFTLFGILVVYAAITFAPKRTSGIDEALQEVAQAPAGSILLVIVALGLMAFGLYSCAEARYRRFEA
jgi:Domain of Unknown Function (DUF1206)